MARDRPSPYGKTGGFGYRSAGPSDAIRASERVSPAIAGEGQTLVLPSVVCDRLIAIGSRSGDLDLQEEALSYRSAGPGLAWRGPVPRPTLREAVLDTVGRGPVPRDRPSSSYVFRSFRTYMSIAARVVPFSRSFRSLIETHAALAKAIKDLKDLRVLGGCACYRH